MTTLLMWIIFGGTSLMLKSFGFLSLLAQSFALSESTQFLNLFSAFFWFDWMSSTSYFHSSNGLFNEVQFIVSNNSSILSLSPEASNHLKWFAKVLTPFSNSVNNYFGSSSMSMFNCSFAALPFALVHSIFMHDNSVFLISAEHLIGSSLKPIFILFSAVLF